MVLWNDSDNSDDSTAQYVSSCGSPTKIPATIEDPNDTGVDDDLMVMCEHGKPDAKLVAFEVISTGRRFLACSLDQANNCGIVQWVHEEWPEHLQNALHKLWLINMKHNHLKEKEKMSTNNKTLKFCWADLKKEKEKLDGRIAELKKDNEKWSIEKSAMECCIAHLNKAAENNKSKLKEIKCIL
ncbi:putative kinesin heavy chain isoform [Hordeum vulgare]|nr:putative kinesin heavy chain isoform [Hordeum vulgare]